MSLPTAAIATIGIITNIVGTAQQSSAYGSAADSALSAGQYNVGLIEVNLSRQLDSLAAETRSFSAKQKADVAASGISIFSKSALFAMNDALSKFEKEAVLLRENAEFDKQQERFVSFQRSEALKTQRSGSIFQGIGNLAQTGLSLLSILSSGEGGE